MKHVLTLLVLAGAIVAIVVAGACNLGGDEGDRCNPLVLQDECNAGLHCRYATCSQAYCCPTDHASAEPNCAGAGCPDTDAAADGGTDATPDSPSSG
jgi:hypothetical protein